MSFLCYKMIRKIDISSKMKENYINRYSKLIEKFSPSMLCRMRTIFPNYQTSNKFTWTIPTAIVKALVNSRTDTNSPRGGVVPFPGPLAHSSGVGASRNLAAPTIIEATANTPIFIINSFSIIITTRYSTNWDVPGGSKEHVNGRSKERGVNAIHRRDTG